MTFGKLKRKFSELNRSQWWWIWLAYWKLWWVQIRLKLFKNQAWLNSQVSTLSASAMPEANYQKAKVANTDTPNLEVAEQMHESVRLAARLHIWQTTCLPRSIVLVNMLKTRALDAHVCIGISKVGQQFASHAWVELEGQMVAEPESVQYEFTPLSN